MIYRQIKETDLPELFKLRVATWHNAHGEEELQALGITQESTARLLQQSHRGWLAELDGRPVGFAMGDKRSGEMWVIAVLKEHEGQGVGRRLLALVEDWLFTEGCDPLWLTTDPDENVRAVGFYRYLGWEDWKIQDGDRFMRKRRESKR